MADVAIILGSQSDLEALEKSGAKELFKSIGITYEVSVISCHRHRKELETYVLQTPTKVFMALASMSAQLAGAISSIKSSAIVFGCPLTAKDGFSQGLDALFSMMRTPPRLPVAVCGIDEIGILNTACLIARLFVGFRAEDNQELYLNLVGSLNEKAKKRPPEIRKEVWDGKSKNS